MNRYFLFGITSLMAFSLNVSAQEDVTDEGTVKIVTRTVPQSKYPTRTVKGQVLDAATGNPIAGALVSAAEVQGYSALTGEDGTYTLSVPEFASAIYVTSPEHNPATMGLKNSENQYAVKLYSDSFQAEYNGTTNIRGDQKAADFSYTNAFNIKEEVQGQLGAYALTVNHNGTTGVGSTIFVQGLNSLNVNAQPLVVLDGVIIDQQYGRPLLHDGLFNDVLSNINPADIESVEVMRNGTALYGAKGANGVLLVNTRRNKSMATRITASASLGVTMLPKFLNVMNADQYRGYVSELLGTTGTKIKEFKFLNEDPEYYYYKQYHNDTDWKKDIYREAFTQNYGLNIGGGDDVANYNLSLGYTSAQSTMKYNDLSRLNIRFNTDINMSNKFNVRFDASFADQSRSIRNDGAPAGYEEGTSTAPSFLAYTKSPFLNPYTYGYGVFSKTYYDIEDEDYLNEALANVSNYN
ncbi:MAG: TonB-dependent receptor plug domain-containing protein, partial [Bacteroidaceae bacterium]|nr:TonB-dependent receptor plug domain-containing protein [Bacteroidaceae bacterium]